MILAVMNAICAIAYMEAWKSQDFNGVWTRDLAISVRRSNQLSYEATELLGHWAMKPLTLRAGHLSHRYRGRVILKKKRIFK